MKTWPNLGIFTNIRLCFASDDEGTSAGCQATGERRGRAGQRGFVVGRRGAGALFTAVGFDAEARAFARARAPAGFFFFVAALFPTGAAAPDATREECLTRCLVFFGAAASATDESATAAISAATNVFILFRTIRPSSDANVTNNELRLR
jgi:hypothetical protein